MFVKKISFTPSPAQAEELKNLKKYFNISKLLREALDAVIQRIKEGI